MSQHLRATRDPLRPPSARPFGLELALQRPPLCPELQIWLLLAQDVDLEAACAELSEVSQPPYWAFCWGAGQALARHLLDHPERVRGREVVDLGTGSGIVAIAAALAGARRVTAVDQDPLSLDAVASNALANGVRPGLISGTRVLPETCELVLAADVLYEAPARRALEALVGDSGDALLSEPDRPGNDGYAHAPLARYEVMTFPDVDSPTRTARLWTISGRAEVTGVLEAKSQRRPSKPRRRRLRLKTVRPARGLRSAP